MAEDIEITNAPNDLMHIVSEPLESLAFCIDLIGITILLYGFVIALFGFLKAEASRFSTSDESIHEHLIMKTRAGLGIYILLALEFMIASDILHTVVTREMEALIFVGALVAIRTAISFFLGREVSEVK